MAKLRRDKIALFLACASILGGKASAAQNVKTGQTIATVGGATLKNNKNILGAVDKSKNTTDLPSRKIENKSFINKAVDWIKAKPGARQLRLVLALSLPLQQLSYPYYYVKVKIRSPHR